MISVLFSLRFLLSSVQIFLGGLVEELLVCKAPSAHEVQALPVLRSLQWDDSWVPRLVRVGSQSANQVLPLVHGLHCLQLFSVGLLCDLLKRVQGRFRVFYR